MVCLFAIFYLYIIVFCSHLFPYSSPLSFTLLLVSFLWLNTPCHSVCGLRRTLQEGTSFEKLPSSDWPVRMSVRALRAQPSVGSRSACIRR